MATDHAVKPSTHVRFNPDADRDGDILAENVQPRNQRLIMISPSLTQRFKHIIQLAYECYDKSLSSEKHNQSDLRHLCYL